MLELPVTVFRLMQSEDTRSHSTRARHATNANSSCALMLPVVSPVGLRLLVALVELRARVVLLTLALLVPSVTAKVPVID